MKEESFQKIELFETKALAKDKEKIDIRKNTIEPLLKENKIDYALEITETSGQVRRGAIPKTYKLNLVIKKEDLEKVKYILDPSYGFEYKILEETKEDYNPIRKETSETEAVRTKERRITFLEKLKKLSLLGIFSLVFIILIFFMLFIFEIILMIEESSATKALIIIMIIEVYILQKCIKNILNKKGDE